MTEKLSAKNVNAFTISSDSLHNQSQKRRGANKNPLNDCIESGITREEAYIVTINKKQKVVVTGDSLLSGISELLRNRQVTVTNFPGGTSGKILDEMENLVADNPAASFSHARTNYITKGFNSLDSVLKIVKCKEELAKHETCLPQYTTKER